MRSPVFEHMPWYVSSLWDIAMCPGFWLYHLAFQLLMWFNIPFSFQVAQVLFSWKTPQKLNVNVIESRNWHIHSRKSRLPGFFVWEFPGVFGGFGGTECLDHQPTLPSPDCIRLSHILSIGPIWTFTIHWHRRKYWYDEFIKFIKPLTPYIPIGWNQHWTAPNAPLMEYWRLNCPTNCSNVGYSIHGPFGNIA